jgi:hypothetical protein
MAKGQFEKGQVPWNKNKKGIHLHPATEFKPGQNGGSKNTAWKGGVQYIKADCVHLYTGVNSRVRRPKTVYEKHYGKIPKGYVIFHLDYDKNNDEIENLVAISRAELLRRNLEKKKNNE